MERKNSESPYPVRRTSKGDESRRYKALSKPDLHEQGAIRSVWMVSREYDGLAGAGGVKDVCRQLAEALVAHGGIAVTVLLPRYGFMDPEAAGFTPLALADAQERSWCGDREQESLVVEMDYPDRERRERVAFWQRRERGVRLILAESPRFAEKQAVYTYTAGEERQTPWKKRGQGHIDYFAMNILLQKAALALLCRLDERPDVLHCHDGHAATLAPLARELPGHRHFFAQSGILVTIHNAGIGYHQDVADLPFARAITGLPASVIKKGLLNNSFDPFVAAAPYAVLNTVSENYARELQETDADARTGWLGHHLLKMGVQLAGVTNGINPRDFDPTRPGQLGIAAAFDPGRGDLAGKRVCKEDILSDCAGSGSWQKVVQSGSLSPDPELPLYTFVGRITAQKGVDVLLRALDLLPEAARLQVLVLGSGDPAIERQLIDVSGQRDPRFSLCYLRGYDPVLANRIYAAGDFFLIPSLYEPCGLTDYIAQLLGNLPIVHLVGGLVKVVDGETGFGYQPHTPAALARTMERARRIYTTEPETIRTMQRAAVNRIHRYHTWKRVMGRYLELYEQARRRACGQVAGDHG